MIKNYIKRLQLSLVKTGVFAALLSVSGWANAQLSGTVTVGTGGTYTNFTALATAVSGSGVSGALTVNVISDITESSTVTFSQNATNATSSTKTITINGNSKKFSNSATNAAFVLNGMDYMTIDGLTIQKTGTGTAQFGIIFQGQADYNTVKNCTIEYTSLSSGSTSGGAYISFTASTTSATSMTSTFNGRFNTIDNNLMRTTNSNSPGPTYGITVMGSSSVASYLESNNNIKNNTIQNFYYMALYNYYTNGDQFIKNDISRANATSMNANTSSFVSYNYYTYGTNRATLLEGNYIHDLPFKGATAGYTSTFYAFYNMYNYGNTTNYFTLKDNKIENIVCNSSNYMAYSYYNYYVNYNGNHVNNWQSRGTSVSYGWYMWYHYNENIIQNNIIENCFTKGTTYFIYTYYGGRQQILNNKIRKNTTADGSTGYTYGYYHFYPSNGALNTFEDNVLDSNTYGSYAYGCYVYYWNGTFNRNKITNNRLYNANYSSYYGYIYNTYLYYFFNLQCNNNLIANNTGYYGAMGIYGFSYNSGSYRAEFKQNTIKDDHSNSGYTYAYFYGMYAYPYYHQKVHVIGNILDVQNTYGCYPAYTYNQNGTNAYVWDYNNYYLKNVSYQYWYCNNGSANDLNGWRGLGFAGNNETGHLPVYKDVSKTDYRVDVFELQNRVPQSFASLYPTTPTINDLDQTKAKRNPVNTDHGARENYMNIQVVSSSISVPAKMCAGSTLKGDIKIKNTFIDTIYNFNVTMGTDKGAKVTKKVTDKILSGDELVVNFDSELTLSVAGKTKVYVYVDAADDNLNDDTLYFETDVLPAPGGSMFTALTTKSTTAIYQYGKPFDITNINQPVYYDINAPRKYDNSKWNSNYTTGKGTNEWTAEVQAYTASGRSVTGASLTAPTTSSDLELKFVTSDATLEDSMITMVLRVIDFENDCDTFIKRNVLIYPSIQPIFSIPAKICEGDAVLFENKSKVLSGSMEFSWDFGTGNAADITEAPEPVFQFPGSGTYKVTLTAKTNPHGFTFDTTVDVVVSPIPTIAFNKVNACEGDALTFTNKTTTPSGAGSPVYTWNFGDGSATKNTTDATHKYSKPGSYNVTLTADLKGCIATMTQKVYQFTKPTAAYSKTEGSCDNDEFSFNNETKVASGLFGSYWNFDDNGAISTDVNATHDFNTSGDKRVKLVVTSEFGCKDSITKTITVKESPKAAYINGPLCSVKPTDFTNTTPNVAKAVPQYTWDFGDGTTSGAKSPTKDWKGNLGPKKVTLTVTLDNGCTEKVTKDLVVLTQPTPNFAAEDVCAGDDVIFVNNTTWAQGEIKYKWDFGDGTTSANSDPTKKYNTSVTLTPFVTLYAYINGGCGDSITKNITINETPRTCDFVAEPDYNYGFYGMKVDPINNSGVVGGQDGVNYVWVFEGGGSTPTSGKNATAYNNFATDGEYKITMRATMQQTGCECSISKKVVMNRSSVEDLQNGGVAVYPNPASGVFTVATSAVFGKGTVIEVMNMNGAVVKRMDSMGGMTQVDASEMSSGMYLVKVSNGTQSITRKVNVQN